MKNIQINREKIRAELERLGWSFSEYARKMGISRQLAHYYMTRAKGLTVVARLAEPLHIDPRDLLI